MAKKMESVYFKGVKTLNELEATYLAYCLADTPLDFEAIDKEYDALFIKYQKAHNKGKEDWQKVKEKPHEMREVVTKLFAFKDEDKDLDFKRDCKVELCGTWLYIGAADGKPEDICRNYKQILSWRKDGACHWSNTHNKWTWHSETGKKPWKPRKQGEAWEMDKIREVHGSKIITSADEV